MIAIRKIRGECNFGMKDPVFEVLSFPSLRSLGDKVKGYANAKEWATTLSKKAGKKNWVHVRLTSDKMYPVEWPNSLGVKGLRKSGPGRIPLSRWLATTYDGQHQTIRQGKSMGKNALNNSNSSIMFFVIFWLDCVLWTHQRIMMRLYVLCWFLPRLAIPWKQKLHDPHIGWHGRQCLQVCPLSNYARNTLARFGHHKTLAHNRGDGLNKWQASLSYRLAWWESNVLDSFVTLLKFQVDSFLSLLGKVLHPRNDIRAMELSKLAFLVDWILRKIGNDFSLFANVVDFVKDCEILLHHNVWEFCFHKYRE